MNKTETTRMFGSLSWRKQSNKYNIVKRTAEDGSACIVRVAMDQVPNRATLILDSTHILKLSMYKTNTNWFSCEHGEAVEVIIKKDEFNPIETPNVRAEFGNNPENLKYETWFKAATDQQNAGTICMWSR